MLVVLPLYTLTSSLLLIFPCQPQHPLSISPHYSTDFSFYVKDFVPRCVRFISRVGSKKKADNAFFAP